MDTSSLLPLLSNLFNNQSASQSFQPQQTNTPIPQSILSSYPQTTIDTPAIEQKNIPSQPQNPLSSILGNLNGGGNQNIMQLFNMLTQTKKSSSPKISELKSVDEYNFD